MSEAKVGDEFDLPCSWCGRPVHYKIREVWKDGGGFAVNMDTCPCLREEYPKRESRLRRWWRRLTNA